MSDEWRQTACILCTINCGIEVKVEGRHIARVRGNRAHVASEGYACEKAQRLDYYQNGRDRLTKPLRRKPDGGFEEIDWDTAIREVAARFVEIRDQFGGESIFYYGGGGQGNHLGGAYSTATRRALGSVYSSNALAQEKTGEFWVDGQLYGGHTSPDFERAEVAIFVGKNPWQSHGLQRARVVLREIASDPNRALIVIDPRRTETAEIADYHLQVRPGTDAFCLAAILGVLVQEDLIDHAFLREHTFNEGALYDALRAVPVAEYAARAGLEEPQIREVARRIARAASTSIVEDLGIEQNLHSTLNSYLEKLLFVLTGNMGKPGAMNLHTSFGRLFSQGKRSSTTPVGGHRIITGLVPCNAIPDEILTDHPKRFRAMLVESANPAHSLADSPRMREAIAALDFVVAIDVAMTETARLADYVLPAISQFEKWEATFFNFEFPANYFCLRAPVVEPLKGPLAEPEIHRRLVHAIGALKDDDQDVASLREAAKNGRATFAMEFMRVTSMRPDLAAIVPVVLYETLGPTLGAGNETAAIIWGLAHTCARSYPESLKRAGFDGDPFTVGEALFEAVFTRREGVHFSIDPYEETFKRIATANGRINLAIPELIGELNELKGEDAPHDEQFPFVLTAGERRSTTANTAIRDPEWRPKDRNGALRMNPADAESLGVKTGGKVRITTRRATLEAVIEVSDRMQRGHVGLPNGAGLWYPDREGQEFLHGVPPNELTSTDRCDWIAGTPFHKHVPARIEAVTQ